MHKFNIVLLIPLLLFFISSANALTYIDKCTNITTSGTYELNISLLDTQPGRDICIDIQADDVELNCAGYSITGSGALYTYGIYTNSHSDITIKNCYVSNYSNGIYLYFSSNNILNNNTANYNAWEGISLYSSPNNTLINNTMNNNSYNFRIYGSEISDFYQDIDASNLVDGKPIYYWINKKDAEINESSNAGFVALISCDNITVKNLNLHGNSHGVLFVNTTHSKILNNIANNNGIGIYLHSSSNNTLTNNTANNSNEGIYLHSSSNNTLTNNTANNNKIGIYLYPSSNYNTLTNNTASNNKIGIYLLHSSSNNTLTNNIANDNWDGILLDFSSDYNTLTNNTASNNWGGILLDFSSNNTLTNNTANSNIIWDIYISSSLGNLFTNQFVTNISTPISFTYSGDIALKGVTPSLSDPSGLRNIGKYINATGNDWLALNISYLDSEISGIDESSLRIAKHNGTQWFTDPSIFASNYGTDATNNIVYANITNFGSIFAVLEQQVGQQPGPGQQNITVPQENVTMPQENVTTGAQQIQPAGWGITINTAIIMISILLIIVAVIIIWHYFKLKF